MGRLTKKDLKTLVLLNDFGYLDESFFMILFHSKATQARHKIIFKVRAHLDKLIKIGFVSVFESFENANFYSLTATGRSHLYFLVKNIYTNKAAHVL